MEAFWCLGAVAVLACVVWVVDIYRHRHPLTTQELIALSRKRQRNRALLQFAFSTVPHTADPAEKKAMKSAGEIVRLNVEYRDAPARIAGLLKYKKHEWIVIAFVNNFHVRHVWWNKGPDGTQVWSFLEDHSLKKAINALEPDCIAILHNHPNSGPSYCRMNIPSDADLRSASLYDEEFSKHGISLMEFICERGVPYLYYANFADSVAPIKPITEEISRINGTGVFKNYSLRRELKRKTDAEQILGGGGGKAALP